MVRQIAVALLLLRALPFVLGERMEEDDDIESGNEALHGFDEAQLGKTPEPERFKGLPPARELVVGSEGSLVEAFLAVAEALPAARHEGRANASQSLLEQRDGCDGHHWTFTGQVLGKGAFGKVVVVYEADMRGSLFAMKTMLTSTTVGHDFVKEVRNMQTVGKCAGTVQLIDPTPCTRNVKSITKKEWALHPYSFVMQMIPGGTDLSKWLKKNAYRARECWSAGKGLLGKLAAQLHCVHQQGLIHRDIKSDNIFISTGSTPCSITDVHLGDFGVAMKILGTDGEPVYARKFIKGGWMNSVHMPKNIFMNGGNDLGLDYPADSNHFKVDPSIDWCSFMFMFKEYGVPTADFLVQQRYIRPGMRCGKMGNYIISHVHAKVAPKKAKVGHPGYKGAAGNQPGMIPAEVGNAGGNKAPVKDKIQAPQKYDINKHLNEIKGFGNKHIKKPPIEIKVNLKDYKVNKHGQLDLAEAAEQDHGVTGKKHVLAHKIGLQANMREPIGKPSQQKGMLHGITNAPGGAKGNFQSLSLHNPLTTGINASKHKHPQPYIPLRSKNINK